MPSTKSSVSVFCHLLLTTICLRSFKPATGDICRAINGPIPAAANKYTWSIRLNPRRKSATFDVQVRNDFEVALVPNRNLIPPPEYAKYKVNFGGSNNQWTAIGSALYNGAVVNANSKVALWLSWAGGVIAAGTGKVVGQNTIGIVVDPSPSPVNYMLIGGYNAAGTVSISYCNDFLVFDRMVPIDPPRVTTSKLTVLSCGRQCDQDPMCVGYSVVRDVSLIGKVACSVYYSISGHQYDPLHVTYKYDNGTFPLF